MAPKPEHTPRSQGGREVGTTRIGGRLWSAEPSARLQAQAALPLTVQRPHCRQTVNAG
jgi:hypothetical protein